MCVCVCVCVCVVCVCVCFGGFVVVVGKRFRRIRDGGARNIHLLLLLLYCMARED